MGALDLVLGPFLIACLFNLFLLAITVSQSYNYFRSFGNSNRILTALVISLLVLDTSQSVTCVITCYYWLVSNFGNVAILQYAPTSYAIEPFFSGFTASIAQMYYAHRLYLVSGRNIIFPAIVGFFSLAQLGWSFSASIGIFVRHQEFARLHEFDYGVTTWLTLMSGVDVFISVMLIYFLKSKYQTDYQNTTNLVNSVIRTTVETNSITSIIAIAGIVLFKTQDTTGLYFVVPQLILSKFYFISLLSSLNSRRQDSTENHTEPIAFSRNGANDKPNYATRFANLNHSQVQTNINVVTEKEVTVDVREDGEDIEDRRSRSGRKPQRVAVAPLPVLLLNFDGLSSVHSETKDSI